MGSAYHMGTDRLKLLLLMEKYRFKHVLLTTKRETLVDSKYRGGKSQRKYSQSMVHKGASRGEKVIKAVKHGKQHKTKMTEVTQKTMISIRLNNLIK